MSESRHLRREILGVARNILKHPTAPFHEDLIAAAIRRELEGVAQIQTDPFGNMIATVGRSRSKNPIAFCSHMDHPGFVLKAVRGRSIDAEFLGWVQPPYFKRGVAVDIFEPGGARVGRARIAALRAWKKSQKPVRLRLVSGRARAGQFGMWALPAIQIRGSRLEARACDDLIGCTAIVVMLRELARRKKTGIGIFTRREEIGLCGAFDLARAGRLPKRMRIISVETSSERCNALQKDGPIVRVGDRSAIFDPTLTAELCAAAANVQKTSRDKFLWQRKLMDGGTCEATAFLKHGYRAGGLCIALGHYHNSAPRGRIAAENVDIGDLAGLVRLMIRVAGS